jgi:selT/selW/selH-like putative selenoprotein
MAQELLLTFEQDIGGVTLVPGTGGVFDVRIGDTLVWSRAKEGRFPHGTEAARPGPRCARKRPGTHGPLTHRSLSGESPLIERGSIGRSVDGHHERFRISRNTCQVPIDPAADLRSPIDFVCQVSRSAAGARAVERSPRRFLDCIDNEQQISIEGTLHPLARFTIAIWGLFVANRTHAKANRLNVVVDIVALDRLDSFCHFRKQTEQGTRRGIFETAAAVHSPVRADATDLVAYDSLDLNKRALHDATSGTER